VRLQLACTLGEWRDGRAGAALAALALQHRNDPYLRAAVLSSVSGHNLADVLAGVLSDPTPPAPLVRQLLGVAGALGDGVAAPALLARVTAPHDGRFAPWQFAALAGVLDALEGRGRSLEVLPDRARAGVARMLAAARATAADRRAAEAERLAGLALLGREPAKRADDVALLGKLLGPRHPVAVQSAALAALGRIPDERVASRLLAGWKAFTPAQRPVVLDLLLGRDAWQRRLLAALEKKEVPAGHLDAARRQRLLAHADARLRARAAAVFAGAVSADRQKVLREHRGVLALKGDAGRGKALFAKSCASCHRLEGVGHEVGPDLAALTNKSPEYLLTEILDPNRNVDTRFVQYLVRTRAGRTFTGLLAAETATSITLRGQEGKQQVLLRRDVEELSGTGKSLMPEGLEKDLSRQDLADLLAYLTGPRRKG
jgi:putative heme-binding domain-containing protein